MNVSDFLDKADRALASARILLESGDVNGACNRAYYAMFDAARAALLSSQAAEGRPARTHSGLIGAFSLHLVKSGRMPLEFGKALNRVAEIRIVADYTDDQVEAATAGWAIDQAALFVAEIRRRFPSGPAPDAED